MNIKTRLKRLEKRLIKPDEGPEYICIEEGDPVPEGFTGKIYVGVCPDDWDILESEDEVTNGKDG